MVVGERRRRGGCCVTSRSRRAPRHEREQPELLPLPALDFDTALVVYRHVDVEGFITQRLNFYSVPWSYIGQGAAGAARQPETEVIIYATGLDEIARHPLLPATVTGRRQILKGHHPSDDPRQRADRLVAASASRNSAPSRAAVPRRPARQTNPRQTAKPQQLLAPLVAHYQCADVRAAFERAVRFGSFLLAAVRRILAACAESQNPCSTNSPICIGDTLDPSLREDVIGPRPTSDYQHLLLPEEDGDETPPAEKPQDEPDENNDDAKPA